MVQVAIIYSKNADSVAEACESLQQQLNNWLLRTDSPLRSVRSVVMDTPKQLLLPVTTALAVKNQAKAYWFVVGMITYDDGSDDDVPH